MNTKTTRLHAEEFLRRTRWRFFPLLYCVVRFTLRASNDVVMSLEILFISVRGRRRAETGGNILLLISLLNEINVLMKTAADRGRIELSVLRRL